MAITTGAELATAVGNWLARADLASRIPEFVALAEAKFNRALRTHDMLTKDAAFSITGEYVAVPTGFLEWKSGYLNSAPTVPILFLPDDMQTAWFQGVTTGDYPGRYVTRVGSNFRFAPVPAATVTATIVYYKALTSVSAGGSAVNWLLTSHPDIYLYGALLEAAPFVHDDPRLATWAQLLQRAVDDLKRSDARSSAMNGMQVRVG